MTTAELLTEQVSFGEAPRWRDGFLWFSDMAERVVKKVDSAGKVSTVVDVPTQPSGLGWLPDGTLLIVSMTDLKLLRFDGERLSVHADLAGFASFHTNDMVVSRSGRAYVGEIGWDVFADIDARGVAAVMADHPTAAVTIVEADGSVRLGTKDLHMPNGCVITPDGSQFIVAESLSATLTAFDVAAGGSLRNRRVWAELGQRQPDGICLDTNGHIWMADPGSGQCVLVAEGGEILDVIDTGNPCFACALGGPDGRTLFMVTATSGFYPETDDRTARILTAQVTTPGTGSP